jgi:hypothetical protein
MPRRVFEYFIIVVLFVCTEPIYGTPVDVDGDGRVGPQEIFDLLNGWSGQAVPPSDLQPWQIDGATIFYNTGRVGIGTNTPNPVTRLNVVTSVNGGWAIRGDGPNGGIGIAGVTPGGANARGVYGSVGTGGYCGTSGDHAGSGAYGLLGTANEGLFAFAPTGNGVRGVANTGIGVWGSSDTNVGVYGTCASNNGVSGVSTSANGVYGQSSTGSGVSGSSNSNTGVRGSSNSDVGVSGTSASYFGVEGTSTTGDGVSGYSTQGAGVRAIGATTGVHAEGPSAVSAFGSGPNGIGIFAVGNTSGLFDGDVTINGEIHKSAGSILIDHPLDPANKFLSHSSVESPDRMSIYNGNIVTDATGYAEVHLPGYFETLNRDFRYQLTVIGQFAQAIIEKKIHDSQFIIRTDKPNVEVSWQVTGIRQDAYAKAHTIEVEKVKPEAERGKYLSPELYGQPKEKGIHFRPEMQQLTQSEK